MIALGVCLWLLAAFDLAFAGFRVAAGRSLLIAKRRYYLCAMARAVIAGQVLVAIAGAAMLAWVATSSSPQVPYREIHAAGSTLLAFYAPWTALVFFGLALRSVPSTDLRSIASVVLFGPLTLLRPLIVTTGGALAIRKLATLEGRALVVLVIVMMLAFGPLLARARRR